MRRISTGLIVVAVIWSVALPAIAGKPAPEFYDTFQNQNYDGNDGSMAFEGPWMEVGENDGPISGVVWVWDHEYCNGGFCLKMGGTDEDTQGHGALRAIDLAGATFAKLSFDNGVQLLDDDSDGAAVVEISSDGGDTWKTLDSISLDKDDGGVSFHKKYTVTNFATSSTVIRFRIVESENLNAYWIIDNVAIEATFETPPPATTSTTKDPATTTTTSTTKAPATTTTTSTTKAPATTTTTHPRDKEKRKPANPDSPDETTTTTRPATTTTTRHDTTSTTVPSATVGDEVPPEDRETMMDKTALAVPAVSGINAMPASMTDDSLQAPRHVEPIEGFAAAFLTESGNFGGNLIPSVLLGIVIAAVSLVGVNSRREG
jgi:hypothetical protein